MREAAGSGVLDSVGFLDALLGLPGQLETASRSAGEVNLGGLVARPPDGVVVCGMGGSGISGDVLAAVGAPILAVPVVVVKGYELPAFVGPRTLVFSVSYSGGTEETLEATAAALRAGSMLVAVCAGGALASLAGGAGAPVIGAPAGLLPRAALGHLVVPLLVVLDRLGLFPGATASVAAAAGQLRSRRDRCAPAVPAPANPARELARRIGRTIPLVYGGGVVGAVAAQRWKADVNENAKAPAFWNTYPELDHNEICGWGQHGDVTRQVMSLVELRHDFEHEAVGRRFEATRAVIEETLAQVLTVRGQGEDRLAQLLDLMYLGDWVSVYLALDAGVDPGPIDAIEQLKRQLAGEAS